MNKLFLNKINKLFLFLVFLSLVNAHLVIASGVTICGVNYDCGADDSVCPNEYGASCTTDPQCCTDADSDTYYKEGEALCPGGNDCNDNNANINPGATETCDGIDQDCDGVLDGSEGITRVTTCGVGACAGNTGIETCTDAGGWTGDTCNPLAGATTETCNGIDDDCDGDTDEGCIWCCDDDDDDGYLGGATAYEFVMDCSQTSGGKGWRESVCSSLPTTYGGGCTINGGYNSPPTCGVECDPDLDGSLDPNDADGDANSYPGAPEICDNYDNDCDGTVDAYSETCESDVGECVAGTQTCSEGQWSDCTGYVGPTTEICENGKDEDCDGEDDSCACDDTGDYDGFFAYDASTCPDGNDCDPYYDLTYPGAPEVCDTVDNQCPGDTGYNQVDEGFTDLGKSCTVGLGVCEATGTYVCNVGGDDTECSATPGSPTGDDSDCDGLDDDCDGTADEHYVPITSCFLPGACSSENTASSCTDGTETLCSTGTPTTETCNGIDDDCDGSTDESLTRTTTCGVGECTGNTGQETCIAGLWGGDTCDEFAGAEIETCDGKDNDCDGTTDESLTTTTGCDQDGYCAGAFKTCSEGTWSDCSKIPLPETCNGIDDDCDGTVDAYSETCESDVGECVAGTQTCSEGQWSDCTGYVGPTTEICENGKDEDCDGFDNACTCEDTDVDGFFAYDASTCPDGNDCDPYYDLTYPGAPEVCDTVDNDCNPATTDGSGETTPDNTKQTGICAGSKQSCDASGNWVDDYSSVANYEDPETSCDDKDNDCDGQTNEDLIHAVHAPDNTNQDGVCAGSKQSCDSTHTSWYDHYSDLQYYEDPETSCDNKDNDCDGSTDESLTRTTTCGVGECTGNTGQETCSAGAWGEDTCNPLAGATADTNCDGKDNDCDGTADDDYTSTSTTCGIGACASTGTTSCSNGVESDSCTAGTPAADDATCDGLDDDCDGSIDEDYVSTSTTCGIGACTSTGTKTCVSGAEVDSCSEGTPTTETCNGIDDDCDTETDEDLTTTCGTDEGICVSGTATCFEGDWINCDAVWGTTETTETYCDGLDQECKGSDTCGCDDTGDYDGYYAIDPTCPTGDDCKPFDFFVNPGADEVCDSQDNNCNGQVDEGYDVECSSDTYCNQFDGCQSGTYYDYSCTNPGTCYSSCDTSTSITDNDEDGQDIECDQDCDDTNPDIYLGATETCNGVDDDCDDNIDENFPNKGQLCTVGLGVCEETGTYVCKADGTGTKCSATPGSTTGDDSDCDGEDDDCDGSTDEDYVSDNSCFLQGACSSQNTASSCTDGVETLCSTGTPTAEVCNSIDDDCDGTIDEGVKTTFYRDADSDTYGNPSQTTQACSKPSGYVSNSQDCNDANTNIHPGATETCNNIDDDCDGTKDESLTIQCGTDEGICVSGTATCFEGDWINCDAVWGTTETTETYCDGLDQECKGSDTCGCDDTGDYDGYYAIDPTCPTGDDCKPYDAGVHPGAAEVCDSVDNNCDGNADEGLTIICSSQTDCGTDGCSAGTYYDYSCTNAGTCYSSCDTSTSITDLDSDNYDTECDNDCDDTDPDVNPGATEICNGIDDDCNPANADGSGETPPLNAKQNTICAGSTKSCIYGSWLTDYSYIVNYESTETTCSDTIDNDCDNTADCSDLNCLAQIGPNGGKCCQNNDDCGNHEQCNANNECIDAKIGQGDCCLNYCECLGAVRLFELQGISSCVSEISNSLQCNLHDIVTITYGDCVDTRVDSSEAGLCINEIKATDAYQTCIS